MNHLNGKQPEPKTVSMRKIAMELLEEEIKDDKRFHGLDRKSWSQTFSKKEDKEFTRLTKHYDEHNYYQKILRYALNIFQFSQGFFKNNNDEYYVPEDEVLLLKTLLKEYMSPFLKKCRSSKLTQIPFREFDQFIRRIEIAIETSFSDDHEKGVQFELLNAYTNYRWRREIAKIKSDIESIIANDWNTIHQLLNFHDKLSLLHMYTNAIKTVSQNINKEVDHKLEVEVMACDELIDDEMEKLGEMMESDLSELHICNSTDFEDFMMNENHKKIIDTNAKWDNILRSEDEDVEA